MFCFLPSVSSAAALTPQQSSSLIAVVQSSPGTPASAFVSLITAFSNITVTQATSLIAVVQAAPGVPANTFVDLLTSFTVDTATVVAQPTIPTTALPAVTPTVTTQPTQPQNNSQPTPVPVTPTPVVVAPMDKSEILVTVSAVLGDQVYTDSSGLGGTSFHRRQWKVSVLDKDGNYMQGAQISTNPPTIGGTSGPDSTPFFYQTANSQSGPNKGDWNTIFTFPDTVTSVTFTSGTLTKKVSI